jgi:hypothetical protein
LSLPDEVRKDGVRLRGHLWRKVQELEMESFVAVTKKKPFIRAEQQNGTIRMSHFKGLCKKLG